MKSGLSILNAELSLFENLITLFLNMASKTAPNNCKKQFFDKIIALVALVQATSTTIKVAQL